MRIFFDACLNLVGVSAQRTAQLYSLSSEITALRDKQDVSLRDFVVFRLPWGLSKSAIAAVRLS